MSEPTSVVPPPGAASVAPAPGGAPSGTAGVTPGDSSAKPADSAATATGATPTASEPTKAAVSRALLKEQEALRKLNTEKAALAAERAKVAGEIKSREDAVAAEIKANPLKFAEKYGITYEEITKAAIAGATANTPESRIAAIEAERKSEREAAARAQQEAQQKAQQAEITAKIAAYVDGIHAHATKGGESFELLNALDADYAKGLISDVADLMATSENRLPGAAEVCEKIEAYLLDEASKLARTKKVAAALSAKTAEGAAAVAKPKDVDPEVQKMIDAKNRQAKPRNLTNKAAAAPTPVSDAPKRKMSRNEALRYVEDLARAGKLV